MAKIKYNRTKGIVTVIKKSKKVSSVAGESYEKLHPYIYREIQKKNREYTIAIRQAGNIQINGDISYGRLEPKIESAIDEMKCLCENADIPYLFDENRIDIFRDVFPLCLTVSEELVPKAQKIRLEGNKAVSTKLSNILFHPLSMLELLCNSMLLNQQFQESTVISIITSVVLLVCQIYNGTTVELDQTCAKVLLYLYQSGYSTLGMDEEKLIGAIIKDDDQLTRNEISHAITTLEKYHCVSIENGKVCLIETIG
nr:hypothetical protein [uncultured Oscillibacter sp.]